MFKKRKYIKPTKTKNYFVIVNSNIPNQLLHDMETISFFLLWEMTILKITF